MARIFAPRIVFQHDRKPTNHSLSLTPRDLITTNERAVLTDPWYSYYSLMYERTLLEQWCAGYTLPWQAGLHSRLSGLTSSLHSRLSGLTTGVHNRLSAIHRADRRRGNTHGKWVSKLVLDKNLISSSAELVHVCDQIIESILQEKIVSLVI